MLSKFILVAAALCVWPFAPATASAAPPAEDAPKLTKPPALVEFVEAEYPEAEREQGVTANVTLRLGIDATGKVTKADVVESGGAAFDAAARAAALQFVFSPAEVDGKPSPIEILYTYKFEIAEEPAEPAKATFEGVVRAGEPVAGITVKMKVPGEAEPRTTTTGPDGRFRFEDVPPGAVEVELAGERLPPTTIEETLESGQKLDVAYDVSLAPLEDETDEEKDDIEIVVVAPPVRREVVATSVAPEEARRVPGTSGDVVRVVENLPGVGRSAAGSGQLVVWGSAPQDTRVYVDGVPIPRLYHDGGLRTVLHPLLVGSVNLVPGGYGAAYGRGLGGMVAVDTATPERERVGGRVHADVLDASAVLTTPAGKRKKLHFAVAARGSYLRPWSRAFVDDREAAFLPIPGYGDGQVRALYRPSSRDSLEAVALVSIDRFRRGLPNPDPALSVSEARQNDFGRAYLRYIRNDSGRTTTVVPYYGYSRSRQLLANGSLATRLDADAHLGGVRANERLRVTKWLDLEVGIDAEIETTKLDRVGALALPPREGDIRAFGQPPPDAIGADEWRVTEVGLAPYAEATFLAWDGKLKVIPGLRIDPYVRSVSRRNPPDAVAPAVGLVEHDVAAEPRLAIVGQPHWRVQLRAATGLYRQLPAPEDLSAAFGTPVLPTSKAFHTVAGVVVNMTKLLSLDVTGFFTRSRDLAMRSPVPSPLRARALEPIGRGRAYGMQVLLRQELWKGLSGWVAYTLMRSERKNGPGEPWRLFDFDQTHVLAAVLAYRMPLQFEASARFRYATGFPRTPIDAAYFDGSRNRYQPLFGAHNSIRIPAFMQLDLRVSKAFDIERTKLEIFLEVLNVWNRANAEEIVYSPDYRDAGYIRGFPVLPVLGVQWDF